ncbi:MAG: thioesterase [Oscillospiraceae bacterium]
MIYRQSFSVDTRDMDPNNQCRPSALLGFLQETASVAAAELRVDRDQVLEKYNVFWMVARMWYRLDRPLRYGDEVTIETWHRGVRAASSYRDFDMFQNGKKVGEAVSLWVLADGTTHKLAPMTQIVEFEGTDGGDRCKTLRVPKLRLPEVLTLEESRRLHYSDEDVNGHVNNARYADFLCDALHLEKLGGNRFVSQLQLDYLAECLPGETLNLAVAEQDDRRYVQGTDEAGNHRFNGFLTLQELT